MQSKNPQKSPTWDCFRYWLLNIIQQNRGQVSFSRIIFHLRQSLPNFLMTQWHEKLSSQQVNALLRLVHRYLAATNDGGDEVLDDSGGNLNGGGHFEGGSGSGGEDLNGVSSVGGNDSVDDNEVCMDTNNIGTGIFNANESYFKACEYKNTNKYSKKVVNMHKDDRCVREGEGGGSCEHSNGETHYKEESCGESGNGFDAEKFLRLLELVLEY